MNISNILNVMENSAQEFERKAKDIRFLAKQLRETEDLTICGEAISVCCNMSNIRIDLLSIYPVRVLMQELHNANAKARILSELK